MIKLFIKSIVVFLVMFFMTTGILYYTLGTNNTSIKSTNTTVGVLNISEEIGECTDGDTIAVSINNDEMHIRFYTTPMKLSSNEKLYIVDRY